MSADRDYDWETVNSFQPYEALALAAASAILVLGVWLFS